MHKIWQENEGRIQKSAFMEAFIFLRVFLDAWLGTIDDIEWIFVKNFLIYNEHLYEFRDGVYQEIQEKILFVTSRDSWKNPFFLYLSQHFQHQVQLIKPNLQIIDIWSDKLSCISRIWDFRKKYIGDIIIPYLCNKHISQVQGLLDFVATKLWNHVVIKNNYWVEGKKVRALNLDINSPKIFELYDMVKKDFFDLGATTQNNPYFVKYYDIEKEYRVYYTYCQEKGIHIYSVKNRENFPKEDESLFQKRDFTRENLEIIWSYMHPDDFILHQTEVYDACVQMIPHLGAQVGVLEVCQDRNGDIRFIELNYLGGSLLYNWADEALMEAYYTDMWHLAISQK